LSPIWLSEPDVRSVLPLDELIGVMAAALSAFSNGGVRQPVRTVIEGDVPGAFFASMPTWIETGPAMGAKLVTVFPQNAGAGLPTHQAIIALLDSSTGSPLAFLDGRYITEARTAAVSAVAVRELARQDATVLALIGSGVQAGSHREALPLVRPFREVRCWSPTEARLRRFVDAHPGVQPAPGAQAAVRDADVVVVATSSVTPVIWNNWVKPGACVVAVGACRPNQRELDPELVARARLIVDSRAAAVQEAGDVVMAIAEGRLTADHIAAELGEVVSGKAPGRTTEDEITVFKSLGLAAEDIAAAHLAYSRARTMGRGTLLG